MSQAEPKHSAEEAVRTAEEQARRAEAEAERFASKVSDRAQSSVRDAGRLAHDEANARVSGAFDAAAGEAERAASAAEDAASNYQSGAVPARALKSVSDLLEDTARGLRHSDLDDVVGNLGRAARRNPVTFLAGAAAVGFVLSVIASVYVVSKTANINPYVPTTAVFVVLTSYGVTGVVTESQLVFFVGPAIFLGILVALSAYANDGALASLSLVFFPVLGYMINAPYGLADGFPLLDQFRIALVFSLLFTLSIGIAGFLIGVVIRRVVDYADMITIEELRHPEAAAPEGSTDQLPGDADSDEE